MAAPPGDATAPFPAAQRSRSRGLGDLSVLVWLQPRVPQLVTNSWYVDGRAGLVVGGWMAGPRDLSHTNTYADTQTLH